MAGMVERPQDARDARRRGRRRSNSGIFVHRYHCGIPVWSAHEPGLVAERLARPHHPLVLRHVLRSERRRMVVLVVRPIASAAEREPVEGEPGCVHLHEPALAVLDEQIDVGKGVEELEYLLGRELGGGGSGRRPSCFVNTKRCHHRQMTRIAPRSMLGGRYSSGTAPAPRTTGDGGMFEFQRRPAR